jgi:hypothetical protein
MVPPTHNSGVAVCPKSVGSIDADKLVAITLHEVSEALLRRIRDQELG